MEQVPAQSLPNVRDMTRWAVEPGARAIGEAPAGGRLGHGPCAHAQRQAVQKIERLKILHLQAIVYLRNLSTVVSLLSALPPLSQ